jgi:hypothetical protein
MENGKYNQMKAWPTRRIHLFFSKSDTSICGSVIFGQCFRYREDIDWLNLKTLHEYDNLNFCQSCLRVAMSRHSEKYIPLIKVYEKMSRPNPENE